MKLYINYMQREDGCVIEATEQTTILELKKKIEAQLNVAAMQQTLMHMGKPLLDNQNLEYYGNIQDGAKLNLVTKKAETLQIVLDRFLRRHYDEEQAKQILDECMRDFHNKIGNIRLNDIEEVETPELKDEARS